MGEIRYDVAVSYARENHEEREYVRSFAIHLRDLGPRVFFDEFERVRLVGANLIDELTVVFRKHARFAVMFVSAAYGKSRWTRLERKAALFRALESEATYLIPVRFDDTELDGLDPGVTYVETKDFSPHALAVFVAAKVREAGPLVGRSLLPGSDVRAAGLDTAWRATFRSPALMDSGAKRADGRWHKRGMDVLYLAPSPSVAILEGSSGFARAGSLPRPPLFLVSVRFPPDIRMSRVELSVLPPEWNSGPGPAWLRELGEGWFRRGETCILAVPASRAERESVYVVNMRHPSFQRFTIAAAHPFDLSDL